MQSYLLLSMLRQVERLQPKVQKEEETSLK